MLRVLQRAMIFITASRPCGAGCFRFSGGGWILVVIRDQPEKVLLSTAFS